jgi:hypothetical protein
MKRSSPNLRGYEIFSDDLPALPANHRVCCGAGRLASKIHPFRGRARAVKMKKAAN